MLELYLGCVLADAASLPLNTAYAGTELRYFQTDAEPRLLVCDPDGRADLAPPAAQADVAHLLALGADETVTLAQARDAE